MLDPATDGIEYIEIYNNGKYPVNLKDLFIGVINTQNSFSYLQPLSSTDVSIYPGSYWVVCSNISLLIEKHNVNAAQTVALRSLPALNNQSAHWQLLYKDGSVIDRIVYDSKWHFMLYSNTKGIALERISINEPTQSSRN